MEKRLLQNYEDVFHAYIIVKYTANDCGKITHSVDLYSHVVPTKQAST